MRAADGAKDLLPMGLITSVDRELAHALALAAGSRHEIDALKRTAGFGDGSGELAQRLSAGIKLDTNDDRELSRDGSHGRRF